MTVPTPVMEQLMERMAAMEARLATSEAEADELRRCNDAFKKGKQSIRKADSTGGGAIDMRLVNKPDVFH